MIRLGLFGYGRMGQEIVRLADTSKFEIVWIYDSHVNEYGAFPGNDAIGRTDVILDFTHPSSAKNNILRAVEWKKNIIVGTTGWYGEMEEIGGSVHQAGIGMLYAQNFSIGVHLFMSIVRMAAKALNRMEEYDICVHERHHRLKADSPSGTAYKLADIILQSIHRKTEVNVDNPDEVPSPSTLYLSSERVGSVPGTHSVFIDGNADSIELIHTARNREGLALGALTAAQWIHGKKGLYTIEDMIHELIAV